MALYTDFNTKFSIHPTKGDLNLKSDVNAVLQSCKNLLLTDKGERLFQPNIGSNIRQLLFENWTPQTIILAKTFIKETIENHEPRAEIIEVQVSEDIDNNAVNISAIIQVINNNDPVELKLVLERIR